MAERSELIIGIDLGTTNSEVAYVQNGEPIMVPNPEGQHKTPSVVGFFENGEIVVGEIARRQYSTNPSNTVVGVKRLIGKYFSEMEKSGEINLITTEVVSQDDLVYIKINNLGYTPQQISGLILKHLKESAEQHLGTEVTQAVISVPAYFDDVQREATIEAGNLAGLEVMRLINEPTAAAMAYGLDKDTEETIAVYDFGGGTFDISILETEQNAFEVLTTTGDTHLGGIDFDNILLDFLLAAFKRDSGVDLCEDRAARLRLLDAAERAKCELSVVQSTLISLPFITTIDKKPIHFEMRISRDEFEPLIEQQIDRTLRLCKSALRDAKLKASDIDRVILVGGSSRIPLVQDAVEDFFGTPPYKGINPDEIVALGAATQAGVLSGALQEVVLLDVTPHTLGIETINNSFSPLIEKNSTLPITSDKTFTTTENDQEYVVVHVLQGDSEKASENKTLGKFTLTGIEKSQAGNPRIKVDFRINTDGVVEISASDLGSGIKQALVVSHHIGNEPSVPRKKRSRTSTTKSGTRRRRKGTKHPAVLSLEGIELTRLVPDLDLTQKTSPEEMKGAIAAMVNDQATTPKPKSLEQPTKSLRRDKEPPTAAATEPTVPSHIAYTPPDSSKYTVSSSLVELEECLFGGGSLEESYESAPNKLIDEYNALIKKYPDRIDNHIALALVYLELGMQEESCAQVKILHQKSSNVTDSLMVLSNKLVDRFPNYLPARVDRAHFFSISDDIDQAIGDFEYLVGKDPANEELMTLLVELYIKKLERNKDSAIQMKLVKLYIRKDDLDQAISLLQILEQDEESHDHASKILGLCFWEKGLFYLAWQKIKSLPVNEELKDILYRLSKDLDGNGQLNAAEYALEKIYSVDIEYKDVKDRINNLRNRIEYRDDTSAHPKESVALDDPRFEVLEEINRGNMGIVYKAKDKALDDIVAVKVLIGLLANDESSVRRFKREARAAKKLSHPNIVRIHDFYETPNKKFLSMEFISGKDLKKILQEEQYLPETVLINYCIQIIKALRYAHSMGIIHRDIKPANIMITKDNVVKITDFGIAKIKFAQDPSQTGTQIIGTPLYMSPEQIQGKEVDGRTDIYSLGIMMYEMLNGTPPFYDGNIEYQHIHTPPSSLAGATASQELKDIIGKCIEKKIENRFASADKLLKALRQIKNEETL